MVCLDNSEWMRNGDYTPTRMEAQHDAANLVCGSKTQQNPESTVGILTMAGNGVQVLCSPTDDMGKILTASTGIKIGGKAQIANGLQIAQLALKHRKNKNGGQRIVVFVGSPIDVDEKKLVKIAKQLKKANVAVDIVSMGEQEQNEAKLEAFHEAVNKNNNSHLVTIPTGVLPSDVLISSPVITGESGSGGGGGGGGSTFAEYGGVDPNLDPELAIALRVSMEEARAEAERKSAESGEAPPPTTSSESEAPARSEEANPRSDPPVNPGGDFGDMDMDEDAMLQQALMMSMLGESAGGASEQSGASGSDNAPGDANGDGANYLDPNFVKGLLTGLPGVDMNDPQIRAAMESATGQGQDEEDDEDEKSKQKKKTKKDKDEK
eukprot:CAMPEP_0184526366 /NCGR_PEP_ID=MMETSP0198_2-20121128/10616_1 /TAXON_ID=1112570 /ORGANISM="Thraustochytrium sp., Strain LLF1b" /LENGTH=378 /DNA_ID=CAMNT_0026917933 /DNA_START=206 /DNA_END=1342 /DNA_ORIENTATION=+